MATEFLMPKLGLTMEEGTITEWFVDRRRRPSRPAAAVLRIETDKTETDVEAAAAGDSARRRPSRRHLRVRRTDRLVPRRRRVHRRSM